MGRTTVEVVEPRRTWRPGIARTPEELEELVLTLMNRPRHWHVYSRHRTMNAAYQRSIQIRRTQRLKTLEPYMKNLDWWVVNLKVGGPTLLVRWVPGSTAP